MLLPPGFGKKNSIPFFFSSFFSQHRTIGDLSQYNPASIIWIASIFFYKNIPVSVGQYYDTGPKKESWNAAKRGIIHH